MLPGGLWRRENGCSRYMSLLGQEVKERRPHPPGHRASCRPPWALPAYALQRSHNHFGVGARPPVRRP